MIRIPHGRRYLKSRMFDPVKPIRTKVREELKSLGGAPSGGTHTPRTRTALHGFSPLLPPKLSTSTPTPLAVKNDTMPCRCAVAEEEEDDDELCSAQKGGVGEISNVKRETEEEKKRTRMLQLQSRLRS